MRSVAFPFSAFPSPPPLHLYPWPQCEKSRREAARGSPAKFPARNNIRFHVPTTSSINFARGMKNGFALLCVLKATGLVIRLPDRGAHSFLAFWLQAVHRASPRFDPNPKTARSIDLNIVDT